MTSTPEAEAPSVSERAIWQDVEFGAYTADLPLWSELAAAADGPVLELGAGAGRVSLHLAGEGHEVIALDNDSELVGELKSRAKVRGVKLSAVKGDLASAGQIRLRREPALVIAPLHVIQTLDGAARLALIGALRDLIPPGTVLAAALVDEATLLNAGAPLPEEPPDMREVEDWVYSSEALWVQVSEEQLKVRRIRERVSPTGTIERMVHDELLHRLSPERFQLEAEEAGFTHAGRRQVDSGPTEADSVVALVEAT